MWQKCENADCFTALIESIERDADHYSRLVDLKRTLSFFETVGISALYGYADNNVLWQRFNNLALKTWLRAHPYIIVSWVRHKNSTTLRKNKLMGLPFEHFEIWLYRNVKDDPALLKILLRLVILRNHYSREIDAWQEQQNL